MAEEKLFGDAPGASTIPLAAWLGHTLAGVAAVSHRWLRVIAVQPAARGRGVGTALLAAIEAQAPATELRTGDQPGNYLVPGIPAADRETLGFFAHRGFVHAAEHTSLIAALEPPPKPQAIDGYAIRRARQQDTERIIARIADAFSPAWAFEARHAMARQRPAVFFAQRDADGALAGFAAFDGQNRGLGHFGPAALFAAHRRRGLGLALAKTVFAALAADGHRRSVIPWIGPREFYARAVGISAEQRYIVMAKDLSS